MWKDAVRLFATAVRELDATEEIEVTKIDCQEPELWEHGKRIAEYMRLVSVITTLNYLVASKHFHSYHFLFLF